MVQRDLHKYMFHFESQCDGSYVLHLYAFEIDRTIVCCLGFLCTYRLWLVPSMNATQAFSLRHKLTLQLQNPPVLKYGRADRDQWLTKNRGSMSFLKKPFPENVHLLSMKARNLTGSGRYVWLVPSPVVLR